MKKPAKPARNALKGYTYQQYICTLFIALMDTNRDIKLVVSEDMGTKQFDDIYLEMDNGTQYRIQVKNYPDTSLNDIVVAPHIVSIKGDANQYDPDDHNIMVINTKLIPVDTKFLGLPATIKGNIIIVPLDVQVIEDYLDSLFSNESRALQIIHCAYGFTSSQKFEVAQSDLPPVIRLSNDLQENTILLRQTLENVPTGITYFVGKPGVGKSHFVNELCNQFPDAIIYRFWIGGQDSELHTRLQFDKFIIDIAKAAFKSEKKFESTELLEQLKSQIVIIDGLDHVENYNPMELDKYINFINSLVDAKVVILSRPLKTTVPWRKNEINNWSIDETRLYLAKAHGITDYSIQGKVFDISKGYPIITFYLAEHYKLHGKLSSEEPIDDLNQYYHNLLESVPTTAMCIFATSNSFFTWHELETLLEEDLFEIVKEFIKMHPYLFDIIRNRISLIHDSLNTYLRGQLTAYPSREQSVLSVVKKSILSGNTEYMARLSSFSFDEEFYSLVLRTYCDFDKFNRLVHTSLDYNSVTSFYEQLQHVLELREDILDIYQYYSFVLIFQIATRNDMTGYTPLVFQILNYIHNHGKIEDEIYSSGYMWMVYLYAQDKDLVAKQGFANLQYVSISAGEIYDDFNNEMNFFKKKEQIVDFSELERVMQNPTALSNQKCDLLITYLVSVWIHGKSGEPLFDAFIKFIEHGFIDWFAFYNACGDFLHDSFWFERALTGAKQTLYELGYFDDNKYLKESLLAVIITTAPEGSFSVSAEALAYLRLANNARRDIDICNLNYVWMMYYERKDYSVYTIDDALIIFESKGILNESLSIEILHRLMRQSEKGIRHLLCDYIDKKGSACVLRMKNNGYFHDDSYVSITDLNPEGINCFEKGTIHDVLGKMIARSSTKTIEYDEIKNLLKSKYANLALKVLKNSGINIYGGNADQELTEAFNKYGISYIANDTTQHIYKPFESGCVQARDRTHIREYGISYLDLARYTDGWYSCLPYPEMFLEYDQATLRDNYLKIIHRVLSARTPDSDYIANWNLLIGNVPRFLAQTEVDVCWDKLYIVLRDFMNASMIYCGDDN